MIVLFLWGIDKLRETWEGALKGPIEWADMTSSQHTEWEEQLLDLDRAYDYLALGRWFRANDHGAVHLGTYD